MACSKVAVISPTAQHSTGHPRSATHAEVTDTMPGVAVREIVTGELYPELMSNFDESQRQVLRLDPAQHARVLGAPGTGKTHMLVEAFVNLREQPIWADGELLVLAPTRLAASALRRQIERRAGRTMAGTPVRTVASLAFSLLQRAAAVSGQPAVRLLTGTAHDEIAARVIDADIDAGRLAEETSAFAVEVLRSDAFRAELRDFARVLDDFHLDAADLEAMLRDRGHRAAGAVDVETRGHWLAALDQLQRVHEALAVQRPGELSSSALIRAAGTVLHECAHLLPRLVLVDDAQELGEGDIALLAALARHGVAVWVFGDPDISTGAFQGERARALAGLQAEFDRRGAGARLSTGEQLVLLTQGYRHGPELRQLVRTVTERVGTAGLGQHRAVLPRNETLRETENVQFITVASAAQQLGVIAHRLRAKHLGLSNEKRVAWHQMAVVCRTRDQAMRLARLLAANQVPTDVASGGVVLREHQLVRELIRLLQHSLGLAPLTAREVSEMLGGVIGGLDPIAIRRLRSALRIQEVRAAEAQGRPAVATDELIFEAFRFVGDVPVIDMPAARRLRALGKLTQEAAVQHSQGATPREVLWRLWDGSRLADQLQKQALDGRGARADVAHRELDAVVGLFFALQRHEEQDSDRPIAVVLEELLTHSVPEDTLAQRSERDVVTVGTPQSLIGREFEVVCIVGLQEASWPNLRARGSLLGVTALQRWLRGEDAHPPTRRDTLHDELRLFAQALSRARNEVLVVSIANEDQQPGVLFALGRDHVSETPLPSSRLTLRGLVAEMRRRVVRDPSDEEAAQSLAVLAAAGIAGAHPDEWYGVLAPSTEAPLSDLEHDPDARVSVSPSQMERAEECPLNWVISRLGGGHSDYRANLGTLVHHAIEALQPPVTSEQVLAHIQQGWASLSFEAEWQELRAAGEAESMARAVADYLRDFSRSGQALSATEAAFDVPIEFARLRGTADRLEARRHSDGSLEITVVDLKTGRQKPTAKETEQHAQLQAYQLGVLKGAFSDENGVPIQTDAVSAKLVYLHPDALGKTEQKRGESFSEVRQEGLTAQQQLDFAARVRDVARTMAAASFTAKVEHHCEHPNKPGRACALHIIKAVSHQ